MRLSPEERSQELVLHQNLGILLKQEELYWKQRSRLRWLKEGDENTKFFHAVANGLRNRNHIPSIAQGNSRIVENEEIGKVFTSIF